ncbi:membrane ORF115 [Cyprinid herpesvirus 2]|uniref:Membrane ORF115 n=1 Tax=Cyprinid herpesvirus 2 TaxID=317878 RepID=A0A0Y0C748_CYHV2|nr:membrane ORF115 [Cyprinid herpesvirus 2]
MPSLWHITSIINLLTVAAQATEFIPAVLRGQHYQQPIYFTPAPSVPDVPSKCSGSFAVGGSCRSSYRHPNFGAVLMAPTVSTVITSGRSFTTRSPVTVRCSPQLSKMDRSLADVYYFWFVHSDGTAEVFAVAYAGFAKTSNNAGLVRVGDLASWGTAYDLTHLAYGARVFPSRDYRIYFTKRAVYMSLDVHMGALFPGSTDANVPRVACGMQRDLVLYTQVNVLPIGRPWYPPGTWCQKSFLYKPTGVCGPRAINRLMSCAASAWIFVGEESKEPPRHTVVYWRTFTKSVPLMVASGQNVEYRARGVTFSWSPSEGVRVQVTRNFFDLNNNGVVEGVMIAAFGIEVQQYRFHCDRYEVGLYHTTGPLELEDQDPYMNDDAFPNPSPVSVVVDESQPIYCLRDVVFVSCPVRDKLTRSSVFTLWQERSGGTHQVREGVTRTMMARLFYDGPGVYNDLSLTQLLNSNPLLGPRRVSFTEGFENSVDFIAYADATRAWFVVPVGRAYFDPFDTLTYGCDYEDDTNTREIMSYRYAVTVGDQSLSTCGARCSLTWSDFLGKCIPPDIISTSIRVLSCTDGLLLECPATSTPAQEDIYWYYKKETSDPVYIGSSVAGVVDTIARVKPKANGGVFVTNDYIVNQLGSNARGTFYGLCGLREVVYTVLIPVCVSTPTLPPWAQDLLPPPPLLPDDDPQIFTMGTPPPKQQQAVADAPLKNQGLMAAAILFAVLTTLSVSSVGLLSYLFAVKYKAMLLSEMTTNKRK